MSKFSIEQINKARITHKSEIPPIEPTFYIRDSICATRGSTSIISGLPKSGKTTVIRIAVTTALMPSIPPDFDNLNLRVTYCDGDLIVYFDTEMTDSETKDFHDKIISDLGLEETPENLHIFHVPEELSPREKLEFIISVYEQLPNIHLAIIDGGADIVSSVLDEKESNEVNDAIKILAQMYRSTIIQIIHENRGNKNVRGHYGQQAERKCNSSNSVSKEPDGTFKIESHIIRHSKQFKPIFFAYDETTHQMVTLDKTVEAIAIKDNANEELRREIKDCFKDVAVMPKKELKKAMARRLKPQDDKISDATRKAVERLFDKAISLQYITTNGSPDSIKIFTID